MILALILFLLLAAPAQAQTTGWIQISPPGLCENGVPKINVLADMSAWIQDYAYDTAAQCQRGIAYSQDSIRKTLQANENQNAEAKCILQALSIAMMASRCVPAESWMSKQK
jgi:hypothetical protein